jgi:hypothetical protein
MNSFFTSFTGLLALRLKIKETDYSFFLSSSLAFSSFFNLSAFLAYLYSLYKFEDISQTTLSPCHHVTIFLLPILFYKVVLKF